MAEINTILNTDALSGLRSMAPQSVHCIVTSPPYFGLRSYDTKPFSWPDLEYRILGFPVNVPAMECELGQEPDHFSFIGHQILIFREAYRVLRDDGTAWVNMGDSYAGSGKAEYQKEDERSEKQQSNAGSYIPNTGSNKYRFPGLKPKDLIGIPWMLAYALRDDGWYLRQGEIWAKAYSTLDENFGSTMPESVVDRFVKSHEDVFLLSKSERYYFDLESIKKPIKESSSKRLNQNIAAQNGSGTPSKNNGSMKAVASKMARDGTNVIGHSGDIQAGLMANKRSVWHHNPSNFPEAHFATFPQELIVDMIKAGCPPEGVVLDMFMGSGTTAIVARKLYRNYIGVELNPVYVEMARRRIYKELGAFV